MKKRYLFSVLIFTMTFLPALGAQDQNSPPSGEEDIFADGAFDQAVAQGKSAQEENKLTWLAGVQLLSDTSAYLPTRDPGYGLSGAFQGKAFLKASKPNFGTLFLSYGFLEGLFAGTNDEKLKNYYLQLNYDPAKPVYSLSEFYFAFDVKKTVFLKIGSQIQSWGASYFWSPADFVNLQRGGGGALVDTRAGKPGIRAHIPLSTGGNIFLFADLSRSLTAGQPQDITQTIGGAFRLDQTLGGFQLGLQGYFGKTSTPQLGATFSGNLLGFDLWGEYAAVLPIQDFSFSNALSVGGERSFGSDKELTIRGEYFFNETGKDDTDLSIPGAMSGFRPLYWGKHYGYSEVSLNKFIIPELKGALSSVVNFSDLSGYVGGALTFTIPELIPFTLYTKYFCGPDWREFTLAAGRPALNLGLRIILEL